MKQIIYIAGPMTGMPKLNRDAFNEKERELTERGYIVLNPATLPLGLEDAHYMDINLAMIRSANVVCMLDGWWKSDGALAGYELAKKLRLDVIDSSMNIIPRRRAHPFL